MNDDYLWDRSGPPHPGIAELERTLAPLGYGHRPPPSRTPWWRWAVAAAAVAAAVGLSLQTVPTASETPWQLAGAPLRAGQSVRTGRQPARIEAGSIGRVDLAPDSLLRAASARRLSLERGELHAFIWARPGEFVVDTPSARAVDLGCEYTLHVDPSGDGQLLVSLGWVAFAVDRRESFIPAGARCRTSLLGGPGIPYFDDAAEPLRQAISQFDRGDSTALPVILAAARPRDSLSLWHLLTRVPEDRRAAVYDRLSQLVALPQVSRAAVIRGDTAAIDLCWNALGLQNTGWWRGWERKWGE